MSSSSRIEVLIPSLLPDTGLSPQPPYPFGCTELGKVGMILVAPGGLVTFQKGQESATFDLFFGGLHKEGAAAAGTDKLVNLSYQFGWENNMGSLCGHW
jgi:hypothetical protein